MSHIPSIFKSAWVRIWKKTAVDHSDINSYQLVCLSKTRYLCLLLLVDIFPTHYQLQKPKLFDFKLTYATKTTLVENTDTNTHLLHPDLYWCPSRLSLHFQAILIM